MSKVALDISGTENGTAPVTVSDGIETVTYRPRSGVLRVEPRHLGAVLGAIPGAVVQAGDDTADSGEPADGTGSGS